MALTAASPALAYSFTPADEPFIGSGKMSFAAAGIGLDCKALFSGSTEAGGGARISGVTFSGGMLGSCGGVHPLSLPWRVKATGARRAVISSVHVNAPLVGDCQGHDVPAVIDDQGVIHFSHTDLSPKCAITGGAVTTRPMVTIFGP